MTNTVSDFERLCKQAATSFLQTVVVVDNEASLKANKIDQQPASPSRVARRRASAPGKNEAPAEDRESERKPEEQAGLAPPGDLGRNDDAGAHRLELNQVSRAFAKQQLTCGVYLPSEDDPSELSVLIQEIVRAILPTDACILDWELRKGDSEPAIESIKNVLNEDDRGGGRLRLILIYTAERLDTVSSELNDALKSSGRIVNLGDNSGVPTLSADHFRIAFANKPTSGLVNEPGLTGWDELPDRIIAEFTELSRGLLRTFALQSVASVRRDMHRILAQFDEELDPVFAGDRATKPDPDDAGRLMVEILQSELMLSIEAGGAENEILGADNSVGWLSANSDALSEENVTLKWTDGRNSDTAITNEVREILLRDGTKNVKQGNAQGRVARSFFKANAIDDSDRRNSSYAALSTLAYHSGKSAGRPYPGIPSLRFGTIIGNDRETLLCVQPACDCVRLREATPFLFVALLPDEKDFDIVLPHGSGFSRLQVPISSKNKSRREIKTLLFAPQAQQDVVLSMKVNDCIFFKDSHGDLWGWRAQLRDMTAVHLAQKVVATFGRLGLNEFEWLRRNGK